MARVRNKTRHKGFTVAFHSSVHPRALCEWMAVLSDALQAYNEEGMKPGEPSLGMKPLPESGHLYLGGGVYIPSDRTSGLLVNERMRVAGAWSFDGGESAMSILKSALQQEDERDSHERRGVIVEWAAHSITSTH